MLGSYENILGNTTNYLDSFSINMQSSHSLIKDTDYAKEVLLYSRSNILIQAGHAMIAQNKQNASNILSLLS